MAIEVEDNDTLLFERQSRVNNLFSTDLYEQLLVSQEAEISVAFAFQGLYTGQNLGKYRLVDFSELNDQYIEFKLGQAEREKNEIYASILKNTLSAIVTLLFLAGFVYLIKKVVESCIELSYHIGNPIPTIRHKVRKKSEKTLSNLKELNTRRIVAEETIRQTARNNLKKTEKSDDQGRAAIRRRIDEALDKGDTETAKILISVLDEIDSNKRDTQ